MGVLGLAVNLGFAFADRRTLQNAADAAALAGARQVTKSLPTARRSAQAEMTPLPTSAPAPATPPRPPPWSG